jgi:hypothetical protein
LVALTAPGSAAAAVLEVPLAPDTAEWIVGEAERAGVSPEVFAASLLLSERLRQSCFFRVAEQTFGPRTAPKVVPVGKARALLSSFVARVGALLEGKPARTSST